MRRLEAAACGLTCGRAKVSSWLWRALGVRYTSRSEELLLVVRAISCCCRRGCTRVAGRCETGGVWEATGVADAVGCQVSGGISSPPGARRGSHSRRRRCRRFRRQCLAWTGRRSSSHIRWAGHGRHRHARLTLRMGRSTRRWTWLLLLLLLSWCCRRLPACSPSRRL